MKRLFVMLAALALAVPALANSPFPGSPFSSSPFARKPPPPELWHGARIGMSRRQIMHAFSGAYPPTLPDSRNGEIEGAVITATIAEHPALVHFYFHEDGLSAVEINFADLEAGRAAQNAAEARTLTDEVTQKYGPPKQCDAQPADPGGHYACRWEQGPVHIDLDYKNTIPPTLAIVYRTGRSEHDEGL